MSVTTFEAVLALLVFVFPGAAFIAAWDFQIRERDRQTLSTVGWGAFVSLLLYTLPQAFGLIDITSLFPSDKLSAARMFTGSNMIFLVSLVSAAAIAGTLLGKWVAQSGASGRFRRVLGRTLTHANWLEVSRLSLGRYARVRTESGEWFGIVDILPEHVDVTSFDVCVFALNDVSWRKDADADWVALPNELVIIPIKTLLTLSVAGEENSDGRDEASH